MVFHLPWPDGDDGLARAVGLFHAGCGVATVLFVFGVARRIFDHRVGLVAAGIVGLFPNLIFMSASAQLETVFNLTVMAAIYVVVSGDWSRGELQPRRLLAFGAVVGLSALVRPFSLLFVPLLGVVVWAAGRGWARALRQVAIVTLATLVVLAPWTIRNVRALHAPVFIATNLGEALCLDRHPGATGASATRPNGVQRRTAMFPFGRRRSRETAAPPVPRFASSSTILRRKRVSCSGGRTTRTTAITRG